MMSLEISVLASGSSGNSIVIKNNNNAILIDCGLSGKELCKRLNKCGIKAEQLNSILVTHEHSDHIKGVGILSRKCDLPIYARKATWNQIDEKIGNIDEKNCCIFKGDFMIEDFGIRPFSISHDAVDPVGYIINYKNTKIGIATDMGCITPEIKKKLKGLDFFVLEANHDLEMLMNGSYPYYLKKRIKSKKGHLSNDESAEVLPDLIKDNFPRILLAHISQENNNPQVAYMTIENRLKREGLEVGKHLKMDYTFREKPTKLYKVI